MSFMKYLLTLFLMFGINFSVLADDQDVEHTHEDEYENGCDNDLDDDMDGDVDGDDEDCAGVLLKQILMTVFLVETCQHT